MIAIALCSIVSCSRVPSYVLDTEDMAQLMADIHIGEGVVDQNYSTYRTDSAKLNLKMSIYNRHGVTPEQVDTSFIWYGHNLEEYNKVYDRTIEIIEERIAKVHTTQLTAAMAIAGDSVDIWNGSRHITISRTTPSQFLSFSILNDENWEAGDMYTWRFKTINNKKDLTILLLVDYEDGTIEQSYNTASTDGWHTVDLVTDSTRIARRIYGSVKLMEQKGRYVYIDSISLTRNRLSQQNKAKRFRQRMYGEPFKKAQPINDSPKQQKADTKQMLSGTKTELQISTD